MMKLYCKVIACVIVAGPCQLPSEVACQTMEQIKAAGWRPAKIIDPVTMWFERAIGPEPVIGEDEVVYHYQIIPLTLPEVVAKKIEALKVVRDNIELSGSFIWQCPIDNVTYLLDGDERSVSRMLKVRDLLTEMEQNGVPRANAVQPWRTAEDQYTPPLGVDAFQNMIYTKGLQGAQAWQAFRTHEETIKSLTAVEDVIAYDITTGWPTNS